MRHAVAVDGAAYPIEPEVGDVMLAAGVEAAAGLDAQGADGARGIAIGVHAGAQLCRQATRGRNAQLAGVGARAGCDVAYGPRPGLGKADGGKVAVQVRQVSFADPA